jgi:biopolymer transport protein ExbB
VARLDRKILGQVSLQLQQSLDDRLATIAVLAAVAPLLGLLGTVLGMIETFNVISVFGTGNSRAMAGGISIALITTQTGLLVAIPGMLMSSRLNRKAQRLRTNLEETTAVLARHLTEGART